MDVGGYEEYMHYDANGNMTNHYSGDGSFNDEFYWDEQDRLRAVRQEYTGLFQYYVYDDKAERTIKANLYEDAHLYQNGELVDSGMMFKDYKLYPNPYVVLTSDGLFTKHYYAGSHRIASRIDDSGGMFQNLTTRNQNTTTTTPEKKQGTVDDDLKIYLEKAGYLGTEVQKQLTASTSYEFGVYYLHGDHLGTATMVTSWDGTPTQFFLNLPFGETMAEQQEQTAYPNPYKFNAKELDAETDLYYYGARYYNPRLSIWYGVDPLAIWNPVMETEFYGDGQHNGGVFFWGNLNPYIYTYQNPVIYIDPNGKRTYFNSKVDGSGDRYFESAGQGSNSKFSHLSVVNIYDSRNQYVKESIVAMDAAGQTVSKYGKHYRQAPNDPNSGWAYTKQVAEIAWESDEVRPILLAPIAAFAETTTAGGTIISNLPRIKNVKELKSLINVLSKNDRKLGFDNLKKLEKIVEKYGGEIRYDLNPVKGKRGPHIQIENLGKSIKSKHIQLSKETVKKLSK